MAVANTMEMGGMPVTTSGKSRGGIWVILFSVLLSAAAAAGAAWYVVHQFAPSLQGAGAEAEESHEPQLPKAPANYFPLDPALVVNLEGDRSQRYLQVQIELMTRDTKVLEDLEHHAPRLRSMLLLLLGQQHPEDLNSRAGKERLQAEVLAEAQRIIREETGRDGVDAVYFTSFVMQ